ncbi:kinetochore-associated protein DSN1 homolog isoform X1 [Astyanax mexicanus]|uniref:kinetochore-associated protein DSN1 homolog isoform X1 n=2 Tax=Astyanax mexicanus TaxID=7994 RepID=UPI0020CAA8AC|nr:kinetochore-associated protein DSN1 homolog isoform X1 [Astyanax mexicanus]
MAALQNDNIGGAEGGEMHSTITEDNSQGTKRPLDRTPSPEPPLKSPRTSSGQPFDFPIGTEKQPDEQKSSSAEDSVREPVMESVPVPDLDPRSCRKSWRRSTRGRRSLPALPSTSQALCKSISQDLHDDERLEKLMEAAMQHTVKRLQNSLQTIPDTNMEAFQTQVDSLQTKWKSLAKNISEERLLLLSSTNSDPAIQKSIDRTKEAISRLQAESLSWDSLLTKHRSKSEELARRVEQGQEKALPLDPSCIAQSSQSKLILNKPDYHEVLCRQHRVLNTMELVLDAQCMMVKGLLSFQQQSQLLVKETSSRLAQSAGFEDLPSSPVRQLLSRTATSS